MATEILLKQKRINKIISEIEDGEIVIPPLQRAYVWKIDKVNELATSILNDYPIGSILLWETKDRLPNPRNVGGFELPKRTDVEYPISYVIDGQQRLTTLYGLFADHVEPANTESKYSVDPKVFDVYYCFETNEFCHADAREGTFTYMPLRSLIHYSRFTDEIINLNEKFRDTARLIQETFLNYEIPLIVTKKRKREEIGEIFVRVNSTGQPLELFDLMVGLTWEEGFHLTEKFDALKEDLKAKHFEAIDNKVLLQCLSAIIQQKTNAKDIIKLQPGIVRDNTPLFVKSLMRAIDFLSSNLNISGYKVIPHVQQIVPLTYYFSQNSRPSASHYRVLEQWFWATSFSSRYRNSTDKMMNDDILYFHNLTKSIKDETKYSATVTKDELTHTKFSQQNPLSRAIFALLSSTQPKDLVTGNIIDTGNSLALFNRREYHHVFPKSYLDKKGVDANMINCVANICVLPADSNKLISDKAPSEYFVSLIPQDRFDEILASNNLPTDRGLYEENDFNAFLNKRTALLLKRIKTVAEISSTNSVSQKTLL